MNGVPPERWAAIFGPHQTPVRPMSPAIPDPLSHAESLRALATYEGFDEHPLVRGWLCELAGHLEAHAGVTDQ